MKNESCSLYTEVALLAYHINDPINAREIRSRETVLLKSMVLHFSGKIKAAFIQREHCWYSIIFHSLLILQWLPNPSLISPHYIKWSFYHINWVMSSLLTTFWRLFFLVRKKSKHWTQPCVIWSLPTFWPHSCQSPSFTTYQCCLFLPQSSSLIILFCWNILLSLYIADSFLPFSLSCKVSSSDESFPDYSN